MSTTEKIDETAELKRLLDLIAGGFTIPGFKGSHEDCRIAMLQEVMHAAQTYAREALTLLPELARLRQQPNSDALTALKQWESDTGKPASASEGNAYMDGWNDGAGELARRDKTARPESVEPPSWERCYCGCHSKSSSRPFCVHCKPEGWIAMPDPYCRMTASEVEIERKGYQAGHAEAASELARLRAERAGLRNALQEAAHDLRRYRQIHDDAHPSRVLPKKPDGKCNCAQCERAEKTMRKIRARAALPGKETK